MVGEAFLQVTVAVDEFAHRSRDILIFLLRDGIEIFVSARQVVAIVAGNGDAVASPRADKLSVRSTNALEIEFVFLSTLKRRVGHGDTQIAQAAPVVLGQQNGQGGERSPSPRENQLFLWN